MAVGRAAVSRGEVHLVRLDPTLGSEIKKTRPCLVVSPDELNQHLRTRSRCPHDDQRPGVSMAGGVPLSEPFGVRGIRPAADGRQRTPDQATGSPVRGNDEGSPRYAAGNVRGLTNAG